MADNPQAVETFYKAQSLAYWSFVGLVIPLIGVILGAMARSRLRLLVGGDEDQQYEIDRVRSIANWGFGISLFLLIIYLVACFAWGVVIGIDSAKSQEQINQVQTMPQ